MKLSAFTRSIDPEARRRAAYTLWEAAARRVADSWEQKGSDSKWREDLEETLEIAELIRAGDLEGTRGAVERWEGGWEEAIKRVVEDQIVVSGLKGGESLDGGVESAEPGAVRGAPGTAFEP